MADESATMGRLWLLAFGACTSCMDPGALPEPPSSPPYVTVAPAQGGLAERVFHASIENVSSLDPRDVALFVGELTSYQLERVQSGELPSNLLERRVSALTWLDLQGRKVTLAPSRVLEPGARYTLAARGYGWLATIDVHPSSSLPLLERIWPPKARRGGAFVVLCGENFMGSEANVSIEPSGVEATFSSILGTDPTGRPCGELVLRTEPEPEQFLVLPAELAGHLVDPEPWQFEKSEAPIAAMCPPSRVALGPACAEVQDDRVTVEAASEAHLWIVSHELSTRVWPLDANRRFKMRGFMPEKHEHVEGSVVGMGGGRLEFEADFVMQRQRQRLIVNEVLSNALGPEPAAEWVEIVNDGATRVNVGGWLLEDTGGAIELPAQALEPGEYALIVREDFVPRADFDVVPGEEAVLIRVPILGKGGLSNAGEMLILHDVTGQFASRFPALPSKRAGVSIARRHPDDFDDEPSAFDEHADPGASPGRINELVSSPE